MTLALKAPARDTEPAAAARRRLPAGTARSAAPPSSSTVDKMPPAAPRRAVPDKVAKGDSSTGDSSTVLTSEGSAVSWGGGAGGGNGAPSGGGTDTARPAGASLTIHEIISSGHARAEPAPSSSSSSRTDEVSAGSSSGSNPLRARRSHGSRQKHEASTRAGESSRHPHQSPRSMRRNLERFGALNIKDVSNSESLDLPRAEVTSRATPVTDEERPETKSRGRWVGRARRRNSTMVLTKQDPGADADDPRTGRRRRVYTNRSSDDLLSHMHRSHRGSVTGVSRSVSPTAARFVPTQEPPRGSRRSGPAQEANLTVSPAASRGKLSKPSGGDSDFYMSKSDVILMSKTSTSGKSGVPKTSPGTKSSQNITELLTNIRGSLGITPAEKESGPSLPSGATNSSSKKQIPSLKPSTKDPAVRPAVPPTDLAEPVESKVADDSFSSRFCVIRQSTRNNEERTAPHETENDEENDGSLSMDDVLFDPRLETCAPKRRPRNTARSRSQLKLGYSSTSLGKSVSSIGRSSAHLSTSETLNDSAIERWVGQDSDPKLSLASTNAHSQAFQRRLARQTSHQAF